MSIVSIKRKQYINFRMRKLIYNFILENSNVQPEEAKKLSENIEQKIVDNYWIKDKRKDINNEIKKAA